MSSSGIDALAFMTSRHQPANDTSRPYLELQLHNALLTTVKDPQRRDDVMRTLNMKPYVFEALFAHAPGAHGFMLAPALLQPRSVGTVRLASADFRSPPLIDPRYLTHQQDVDVLLEGNKIILHVLKKIKK